MRIAIIESFNDDLNHVFEPTSNWTKLAKHELVRHKIARWSSAGAGGRVAYRREQGFRTKCD